MNQCGCGATSALGTNRDRRRERRGSRVLRERSGVMKPALLMSARAPAARADRTAVRCAGKRGLMAGSKLEKIRWPSHRARDRQRGALAPIERGEDTMAAGWRDARARDPHYKTTTLRSSCGLRALRSEADGIPGQRAPSNSPAMVEFTGIARSPRNSPFSVLRQTGRDGRSVTRFSPNLEVLTYGPRRAHSTCDGAGRARRRGGLRRRGGANVPR